MLLLNNCTQLSCKGMSKIPAPLYDQILLPPWIITPSHCFQIKALINQQFYLKSLNVNEHYDCTSQYLQVALDEWSYLNSASHWVNTSQGHNHSSSSKSNPHYHGTFTILVEESPVVRLYLDTIKVNTAKDQNKSYPLDIHLALQVMAARAIELIACCHSKNTSEWLFKVKIHH